MSNFRIKTCVLGQVGTNCYIVYDEEKKQAVIIDPADNGAFILNKCKELEVTPVAVLLTHGHFDHIMAAQDIKRAFGCKIYASRSEATLLRDPALNLSASIGGKQIGLEVDYLISDGETLKLGGYTWKALATPGHTAGSLCYWIASEAVLLSGDTLFAESLGRTDLPTASLGQIIRSIKEKLFLLPDETMVYPGHGEPTSIGHEKQYNPIAVHKHR